jgi:hypothetical protein
MDHGSRVVGREPTAGGQVGKERRTTRNSGRPHPSFEIRQ